MGWYYVTLAVDGNICSHIETGLNYDIADGKVSAEPTREKFFAAGALKDSEPISLIDLANAIHADKERGKEEKPSIRAQLRAAKEQTAQRKAQRSKTQDLERI